jgi:hypothetical protein
LKRGARLLLSIFFGSLSQNYSGTYLTQKKQTNKMGCVDRCKEALFERDWPAENGKNRQETLTSYCMHGQRQDGCRHCAAGNKRQK